VRRWLALPVLVPAIALLIPGQARADSDGYYCAGPGYVALELRSWSTGGPHLLKVVRFEKGRARWAGQVTLADFQAREMSCDERRVRIRGWGRGYVSYTVDVGGTPRVIREIEDPDREPSPSLFHEQPANLGEWAHPGRHRLVSTEEEYVYRLVITVSSTPLKGEGMEHHIRSSIVCEENGGTVLRRFIVFDGTRLETVDESWAPGLEVQT